MDNKDLFTEESDKTLLVTFAWWEKNRIPYNLIVGATGIIVFMIAPSFNMMEILGIILYGIMANLFYSLGFLTEIAFKHYFKKNIDFESKRKLLYILGVIISIVITIGFGMFRIFIYLL